MEVSTVGTIIKVVVFQLTSEVEVGGQYRWHHDKGGGFPTDPRGSS